MKRKSMPFAFVLKDLYGMDDTFWPLREFQRFDGYVIASPTGYKLIERRIMGRGFPLRRGLVGVQARTMMHYHIIVEECFVARFLEKVQEIPSSYQNYAFAVSDVLPCP